MSSPETTLGAGLTAPQRQALLACLELLDRFAGEGICMGDQDADDPALALLGLSEAFGDEEWPALFDRLRAEATHAG